MKTAARIMAIACKLALVIVFIPVLAACSNESNDSRTVTVSLSNLQSQLGYGAGGSSSALTAPTANEAVSLAKSIAVGAMVVNSRSIADKPYSFRVPISDVEGQLESDIRNSANFIVLRNLPTDEGTIDIEIPPAGSQKYQIIAAALTTQPTTVGDLGEAEHQDSVIYIGFDERFLKTSAENQIFALDEFGDPTPDAVTEITITLIRACLVEPQAPPKGCAQFEANGNAVVSSAVEITAMYVNEETGNNLLGSFPLVVQSDADPTDAADNCSGLGEICSPEEAATILEAALAAQSGVTSVEVHTTHQLNVDESTACKEAATTISGLESNCNPQVFFTPL